MNNSIASLFSLCRDPVLGLREGTIEFANPAAAALLGAGLEGRPAAGLLPEYMISTDLDGFVCSTTLGGHRCSASVVRRDGLTLISLCPLDASERRQALPNAALMAAVSSAMGTLRLAADRLTDRLDAESDPKTRVYSSALYHNYYILLRLINNLRTASALMDGSAVFRPRDTDLVRLCAELTGTVARFLPPEGARLGFRCDSERLIARVDPELCEQMLLNLLANSLLHTGPGGNVTLSLRLSGERVIFSVDDDGSGIPEEVLPTVFNRFDQELSLSELVGGAGLGLTIARGVAERHGGALIIESRPGMGASVRIMLPLESDMPPSLRSAGQQYRLSGANAVLTELSGVLGSEFYVKKYLD